MPEVGSLVVYGIHGVCKVTETVTQSVNQKKVTYYALEPVHQAGSRYLIPVENEAALARLRPLLPKEQREAILKAEAAADAAWLTDDALRKQNYKDMMTNADCAGMVHMVHMIHLRKARKGAVNSKTHMCDDNFLKDAVKILLTEFSIVMDMSKDEVLNYIGSLSE